MPRIFLDTSMPTSLLLSHLPSLTLASARPTLRAVARSRVMVCSAAATMFPAGLLTTIIPCAVAAGTSMLSTPTLPALNQSSANRLFSIPFFLEEASPSSCDDLEILASLQDLGRHFCLRSNNQSLVVWYRREDLLRGETDAVVDVKVRRE